MSTERTDGRAAAGDGERGRGAGDGAASADALEFVRYCYRRRGLGWPELYDEMCATAARGGWRGMGYDQLATIGIGFSLRDMPMLIALASQVTDEDRPARPGERAQGR